MLGRMLVGEAQRRASGGLSSLFSGISYGARGTDLGSAGDWFVDQSVASSGDGTGPASAFKTIGEAVSAAAAAGGDQSIRVLAGTYREEIDFIWNSAGLTSLAIKAYGTDRPVISGAEPLTGWTPCQAGDAAIVGGDWENVHKVTVARDAFPAPGFWGALMREGAEPLTICGLRRPSRTFPDFFFDSIDQTYRLSEEGDLAVGLRSGAFFDTITHPSALGNFTDAQLDQAVAVVWASPNIASFMQVAGVSGGVIQLENTGVTPNPSDTGYALLNVLPNIERGQWGYRDNGDGTVTFYLWPYDPANLVDNVEIAVRTKGLRVYRQRSNTPVTIEGFTFEMCARVANDGYGLSFDGTFPLAGNTGAIRHCTFRHIAGEKCLELKFQEQGIAVEHVTFRDSVSYGLQSTAASGRANYGHRVRNCLAQDLSQSGFRIFGLRDSVFTDLRALRTSAGGHANAINFYQGCDKCIVLGWQGGVRIEDRLYAGYGTNQRSSNIVFLHGTFTPGADGRAYVDQSNAGGTDQPYIGEGGMLINCWVPDMQDRRASSIGNGGITVGKDIMPWEIHNCVTPAILNTGGTLARSGNILTWSTSTADASEQLLDATGEHAIHADAANFDWRARPGSPLATGEGAQDLSSAIQSLETWFPGENFRRDANGRTWDPADPGFGPFGKRWRTGGGAFVAPPAPSEPAQFLVQGPVPGYFVDTAGPGSGVTRIAMRGKLKFEIGSDLSGVRPFGAVSTSFELSIQGDESVNIYLEDGTGQALLANVEIAPAGAVRFGEWQSWELDMDQVAGTASLTVGNSATTIEFTASANAFFQTVRAVHFLARSTGANAVPENTGIADLEVDFNGVLHKAIQNDAASANADGWHRGGAFTSVP